MSPAVALGHLQVPFSKYMLSELEATALTITVIVNVVVLPAASSTEYVKVYVPTEEVSTAPEDVIEEVRSPSTSSVAVAPGSVKVSPTVRLMLEEPIMVIAGAVVSFA